MVHLEGTSPMVLSSVNISNNSCPAHFKILHVQVLWQL